MAKEIYDIIRFDGGIDNNSDKRNIGNNQLTGALNIELARNMDVNIKGIAKVGRGFHTPYLSAVLGTNPINPFDYAWAPCNNDENLALNQSEDTTTYAGWQRWYNRGQGIFAFISDYTLGINGTINNLSTYKKGGAVYICFYTGNGISLYDVGNSTWINDNSMLTFDPTVLNGNVVNGLTEGNLPVIPIYTYSNGELTVCDANFDQLSTDTIVFRLVRDVYFKQTNVPYTIHEWIKRSGIIPTAQTQFELFGGVGYPLVINNGGVSVSPSQSHELAVNFTIADTALNGTLEGTWSFGFSYVYAGGEIGDVQYQFVDPNGDNVILTTVLTNALYFIDIAINWTTAWDPSIQGCILWAVKSGEEFRDWEMWAELDFSDGKWYIPGSELEGGEGVMTHSGGDYSCTYGPENNHGAVTFRYGSPISYGSKAGRNVDEDTKARYKTAIVHNNRLYAGNILQGGRVHGDRILVSPTNQHHILPEGNTLDVAVHDGDEIIHLESFGDRILQFKKNSLYVVNASGGNHIIESEYKNYGVNRSSAVCKTPAGICFANRNGAYIFNGEKVTNLHAPQQRYLVSRESWKDFTLEEDGTDQDNLDAQGFVEYDREKDLTVGYEPVDNILLIYNEDGKGYNHNLTDGSITETDKMLHSGNFPAPSNIFNIRNKTLCVANFDGDYKVLSYSMETKSDQNSNIDLKTKDIDLGIPGVRKKIHAIYITYRSGSDTDSDAGYRYDTHLAVTYALDGSENFSGNFASNSDNLTQLDQATNQVVLGSTYYTVSVDDSSVYKNWEKVRLKPSVSIRDAYSIQLRIANNMETGTANQSAEAVNHTFEIDNISIVYSTKNVR